MKSVTKQVDIGLGLSMKDEVFKLLRVTKIDEYMIRMGTHVSINAATQVCLGLRNLP